MPAYGPYETTRELASGHGSIVYSARKAGEARDNYAIKVFSLEPYLTGNEEDRTQLDALVAEVEQTFVKSVEVQKKAAATSRNVAPIFEVGQEQGSIWYATKLYPRSVYKLLEGRVALGKEWFFHIISSVARGALDIKKACGRSHGEIQPSNILISASQKIHDAEVVLADPLPGDTAEGARYEKADLNAIGQIIFQLVRRREVEDASDHSILPLMPSAEWTSIFEKDTEAWLSLCNRLLDPNLSLEHYSLEKLDAELARLRPKPPVTGKVLALAAVLLLLLGLAGVYFVRTSGKGTLILTSHPSGAQIQLNGETLPERTPVKVIRPRGNYEVRAEFTGLEPQVLPVELNSRRVEQHISFPHATVVLESDPAGASILVGGTNLLVGATPAVTPYTVLTLKPGAVVFQFDLKGFLSTNLPLTLQTGTTNRLSIALTRPPVGQVVVEFDSIPRGARIELDGKAFATTLETKSLAPGSYKVTGHFRDIWPVKETNLVVSANQEAKVQFYFERGRFNLESDPPGANVYVSNRLVAVTPTNGLLWPMGPVTFRFEKPGFEATNVVTQIVQDNERVELSPRLVTTNGIILLTIEPAPAVVLDATTRQEIVQTTPGRAHELTFAPGTRAVIIQASGYQPLRTNLVFLSKQRVPMSVRLPAELIPVAFSSDPPGADLYDTAGRSLGAVEAVSGLPVATHALAARHTRHPTLGWITNEVLVVKGRPNPHVFKFSYSTMMITSSPSNLKVYEIVDGGRQFIGITPTNRQFLPPGPRTLEFVKADGTETNVHRFVLQPGVEPVGTYFRPPKPPPFTNSIGMVFEWINPQGTNGGYWVGRFEVTQAQFQAVIGSNPSTFKNGNPALLPVETVSVEDARKFCAQMSARDLTLLQSSPYAGWMYALPTQAQWDYYVAAVPLTNAVTSDKGGKRFNASNVGTLPPNEFELYDVRGNVWEWCAEGVLRGGAYDSFQGFLKLLNLDYVQKPNPNMPAAANCGFRCVLVPPSLTAQR